MKKMNVLKLGTVCRDKATELEGTLTHLVIGMDLRTTYLFQPKGLDSEGQPVKKLHVEKERLDAWESDHEMIEVPADILGTEVADKASGFSGTATKFILHINGCFHVMIQPKGISPKTGSAIEDNDFDLRECTGEKIRALSEEEFKKSKEDTPSPSPIGSALRGGLPKDA